jgi:colanic acid biosynthesis glycosyl transferase WcaI
MRILIVNIYFYPDPTGTGLVMTDLARDLAARGHEVTVITSFPHYGGVMPQRSPPRVWREERMDGIRVIRTAVYVPRRRSFWARALNYTTFSTLALVAGLGCGAQDVVFCTSPPLLLGATVSALSGLKRAPFVFNVQDIYPDAAVLMGMLRNPWLIALSGALESFVYRRAALVTVIGDTAKRNLLAKGVPETKIAVIPNWVDIDHISPMPAENEFRRSLAAGGNLRAENSVQNGSGAATASTLDPQLSTKLVMFAGNIGLIAGLETVLDAAAVLRRRSDLHFLIVGEGNAKADLVARAQQLDLPNVTFLSTQPREILSEVLAAADVHLVTLKRRMSATSLPSKTYGIMASGRPMVAAVDPGSEVWRLVEAAQAGVCVRPEEPSELARALESLCDDPEQRRLMGENARAYVVRHNAQSALADLYEQTLQAVATGRVSGQPYPVTGPSPLTLQASPLDDAGVE